MEDARWNKLWLDTPNFDFRANSHDWNLRVCVHSAQRRPDSRDLQPIYYRFIITEKINKIAFS